MKWVAGSFFWLLATADDKLEYMPANTEDPLQANISNKNADLT